MISPLPFTTILRAVVKKYSILITSRSPLSPVIFDKCNVLGGAENYKWELTTKNRLISIVSPHFIAKKGYFVGFDLMTKNHPVQKYPIVLSGESGVSGE